MIRIILLIIAVLAALTPPARATVLPEKISSSLNLLPDDAQAAIVIPDLKRFNERLTDLLQRMERPALLAAGRPIDVIRAWAGMGSALDENGPAVGCLRLIDGQLVPMVLVSATDPDAFLKGNFKTHDADPGPTARLTLDGRTVYVKAYGSRIAISPQPGCVETYLVSAEWSANLTQRLNDAGAAVVSKGDVLVWINGRGAAILGAEAAARAPAGTGEIPAIGSRPEDLRDALISLNFDPLGLLIRAWAGFDPDSPTGQLTRGGSDTPASTSLGLLPRSPYYLGLALDLAGIGGIDVVRSLAPQLELPEWLRTARAVQMAVYPSKLGVAIGGILNDASLVIDSSSPADVLAALKSHVLASAGDVDGVRLEPIWEDERTLKSGSSASAFEIKETVVGVPENGPATDMVQMTRRIIFGQRGFHGLARVTGSRLVMTFSQRPDVFDRAVAAADGGSDTLGSDGIIKAMRRYLLEQPDMEGFISLGQLSRLAKQVAGMVPGLPDMVPDIETRIEPIGFAVEVQDSTVESAAVVSAGVLAVMIDLSSMVRPGADAVPPGAPAP